MTNFASLCVLSYERGKFLKKSFDSLKSNTSYRHEIIINDDGSKDSETLQHIADWQYDGKISWAIFNAGKNMGVGKAFRNCIGVSSGRYIFKLDDDLEYKHRWLEKIIGIIDNNEDVGAVGLFDYRNYDPKDDRFEHLEEREDCFIVTDFVNSGYGFKREYFDKYGDKLGDDGWQTYLQQQGLRLAIPKKDVAHNFGFGEGKSIYVQDGKAIKFHGNPRTFYRGLSE